MVLLMNKNIHSKNKNDHFVRGKWIWSISTVKLYTFILYTYSYYNILYTQTYDEQRPVVTTWLLGYVRPVSNFMRASSLCIKRVRYQLLVFFNVYMQSNITHIISIRYLILTHVICLVMYIFFIWRFQRLNINNY